jgi:hypothetical protein
MQELDRFAAIQEVCDGLSEAGDAVTRELLTRLADKWSLWLMGVLAHAGGRCAYRGGWRVRAR